VEGVRRFRHPARDELRAWLDGADNGIDDHVATCDRCATLLEELASPPVPAIAQALAEVYEAPSDLAERLERRVTDRLDSRVIIEVVADLFGAGLDTSKLLLTEEPPHD
jgi:hypothetical protein